MPRSSADSAFLVKGLLTGMDGGLRGSLDMLNCCSWPLGHVLVFGQDRDEDLQRGIV